MLSRSSERAFLFFASWTFVSSEHVTAADISPRDMGFSWQQLTPSSDLSWVPCFDIFNCTQFEVPLDYDDTNAGTTNIAVVKYSAEQRPETAQSIFVNGGGPGEGIDFLLDNYAAFRTLFGPQYNLIGFDPRGINNSGPIVDCFGPEHADAKLSWAQDFYREAPDVSIASLKMQYEAAKVYAGWCSNALSKNESVKYISSPAVATDILSLAKAEARAAGKMQIEVDQVKVYYYAISYGTVIGATFASLYPDNVGRIMIDGVVDGIDYYTTSYSEAVLDADAALQSFSRYCFEAGQGNCSFWGPSEQNITDRVDAIFSSLREFPLPYAGNDGSSGIPGLATYTDLRYFTTATLYRSRDLFPVLSDVFLLLENGNGTAISEFWQTLAQPGAIPDANILIECVDGYGRTQANRSTFENYEAYITLLTEQSKYFGPLLPAFVGIEVCSIVDIPGLQSQVNGSLGESLPPSAQNTSYPLLFASATLDPVTPLRSARKMQTQFPGSSLLIQNATSHSGSYSASACFIETVQKYFNGTLESGSEVSCQEDAKPFQGVPGFLVI